jgi:hypothetical protein
VTACPVVSQAAPSWRHWLSSAASWSPAAATAPGAATLDSLNEELANTDVDDPGYNDLVSQAKQAEADCNKGGGY